MRMSFGTGGIGIAGSYLIAAVALIAIAETTCLAGEDGLVGHWSGDEIREESVVDSSRQGSDGVSTVPLEVVRGVEGTAMLFAGKEDRVEVPHSDALNLGLEGQSYSISFWFSSSVLPETDPAAHFITKWGSPYPFSFVQFATGTVEMRTYDGKVVPGVDSGIDVSDGSWHFVVGMRDGAKRRLSLYVDGLLVSSCEDTTKGDLSNEGPLYIGRSHGDDFNGALDEVKLYDRLLSKDEIHAQYVQPGPAAVRTTGTRKGLAFKRATGVPAMRREMENWKPTLVTDGNVRSAYEGNVVRLTNSWMDVDLSTATGEVVALVSKGRTCLTSPGGVRITDVLTGDTFAQNEGDVVSIGLPDGSSESAVVTIHKRYSNHYEAVIAYTLGRQALCCDVELSTSLSEPRESRIEFSMPVLEPMTKAFWVRENAPFDLADLPMERVVYRHFSQSVAMVLPALTVYDESKDVGLAFIAPLDLPKPGMSFNFDTLTKRLEVSNYRLRLEKDAPARAAVYIVPHEGCWRPSLAWMLEMWPEYFRPGTPSGIETPGWYRLGGSLEGPAELATFQEAGAKWFQIHNHYPFLGSFMPESETWEVMAGLVDQGKADLSTWEAGATQGGFQNSYDQMREAIRLRQEHGMQSFLYFQSFELWDQYAKKHFPDDIARGRSGGGHPAWYNCSLMNPDPAFAWGKHIAAQIEKVPEKYPVLDGIFYDRDDYRYYDYAHDDGVTMDLDAPVYMLGFAQQQINDVVTGVLRKHKMGIFTNSPTSVEVVKYIDGIMCETPGWAACHQYLGIARPMVLLPYFFETTSYDTTPKETEAKMQLALSMGYFPSLTYGGDECKAIDARYRPLFDLMGGREWVLSPRPLILPEGMSGNIFRSPKGDYILTVVDFKKSHVAGDAPTHDVTVEISVPDAGEIGCCYSLSGDGIEGSVLLITRDGQTIRATLPEHLACSMLVFSGDATPALASIK